MTAGVPARPYAVVYDGSCAVCGRIVARLEKWDRRGSLEMVAAQAPGVGARFPWIPERALTESLQVVRVSDGRTWQGAAALEQLLDVLPRGRWVSWLFALPFARPVAEKLYRWFARNRYRMGCGKHCRAHPHARTE